jgi:hypothetical protein
MSADISNPLLEQKPEDVDVLVNASKGSTGSNSTTTAWQQYGDKSTSTASTEPVTTSNDSGSETAQGKGCMGDMCTVSGGRTKKSKSKKSKKSKSKKSKKSKSKKSKKSKSKKSKSKKSKKSKSKKSKKTKSRKSKKC